MADPIVRVHWPYDGFQEICIYASDDVLAKQGNGDLAGAAGSAVGRAQTRAELRANLEQLAEARTLRLSVIDQPDHADPLGLRISVAFLSEGGTALTP